MKGRRHDEWTNVITGLGIAGRDWRTSTELSTDAALSWRQIDDLYRQDNLAARIVDEIAENACRRWIRIVGNEGADTSEFQRQVFAHLERLKAKQSFLEWLKKGRKDGGALLLIGADDGRDISKPIQPSRVREIRHLHCIESRAVVPDVIDLDPMSDNFGCPLMFRLLPRAVMSSTFVAPNSRAFKLQSVTNGLRIHYSRVFMHDGVQISERLRLQQKGWGDSVFQRAWASIENYRVLWGHIATLFKHVAQTVVKLSGYADLVAGDFEQVIQKRLSEIQMARSTMNVVPLDAEDALQEQTLSGLSGALEIFKYAQEDLAQTSDMPLTRLFGHRPAGFSSQDQSGQINWNQRVRGLQEDRLYSPLMDLIALIVECYNIPAPDNWHIEFLPLEEPSEAEAADTRLKNAQADDIYVKNASLEPGELRETLRADPKSRFIMNKGPARHDIVANPDAPVHPPTTAAMIKPPPPPKNPPAGAKEK
jgi:phage-related protein (TIGR01555 family)